MKDILLVEDSELDAQLVLRALKRHRIANPVRLVRDGLEAMNYLRQTEKVAAIGPALPGVLLLDLRLPGMSGYEILECIQEQAQCARMLRVVLSQLGEVQMIKRAYELGADSYLVKPLCEDDLLDLIAAFPGYWAFCSRTPAAPSSAGLPLPASR